MTTTTKSKPSLNPNLKAFWKTKSDLKVLKGGRASSKTWDAAGFAIFLASHYKVKFLCMRQFQNKIKESVYAILKIQIERFGLKDQFEVLASEIRHKTTGSSFHFYGIHRDIAEIKGFEGADIGWIEEGEGLTKEQWEVIEPTIRSEGAECWILYNPRLVSDYVEEFENDPENGVLVHQINYDENPFLSSTMIRKIERMKAKDYEQYQHIYLGIPLTDDDDVVIKRSWIEAAIDAHIKLGIKPTGVKRIGFDVADSGKDLCAQVFTHGIVTSWGELWQGKEDELLISSKRVYAKAFETGSCINYDSIGVGSGCGAKFDEMNDARKLDNGYTKISYSKFIAGAKVDKPDRLYIDSEDAKVTNEDFFENLKAQAWWNIADRFRNTYNAVVKGEKFDESDLISISSSIGDLKTLVTELSTPKRKFSKAGKVMVESKDDLKKREVASPNYADAFIMSNFSADSSINPAALMMTRRRR
jgi:phage terminase large subunit